MSTYEFEPDQETFAIVVLGDFNPAIFHPAWFSANKSAATRRDTGRRYRDDHQGGRRVRGGKHPCSGRPCEIRSDHHAIYERSRASGCGSGDIVRTRAHATVCSGSEFGLAVSPSIGARVAQNRTCTCPQRALDAVSRISWHATSGHRRTLPDCEAQRIHIQVQPLSSPKWSIMVRINQHYRVDTAERPDVRDRHDAATRILDRDWPPFCAFAKRTAAKLLSDCLQKT